MNKRLQQSLLTLGFAAMLIGCGTTSDSAPLVPDIVSITIDDVNTTTFFHAIALDTDQNQLTATVLYTDGTSSTASYQLDWESNETNISVNNGLVTAEANQGTAAISASYRDKLFTPESKTVTIIPLTDINITSQDINITADDTNSSLYHLDINTTGEYTLQSYGTFEDNQTTSEPISSNIEWTSSNTSVATVNSTTGVLNIIATGTADINVSVFNDLNKTLQIDVNITL